MRALAPTIVLVVAMLAACQPRPFPERSGMLPESALGPRVTVLETSLPVTTPDRLDAMATARLDRFAAALEGGSVARALVEVPPGRLAVGERIAARLADRGIRSRVEETAAPSITVIGERIDVVASRCPDFHTARLAHPLDPIWGNPNPADRLTFGCVNDANLEAMVADTRHLGPAARTDRAASPPAVGAVRRYYDNAVTPLRDRSLSGTP